MKQIQENFSLKGRVAVVTGAGSGLGKAFANALAVAGAKVCCMDRDEAAAVGCAKAIIKRGGQASSGVMDVSLAQSVSLGMRQLAAEHGSIAYWSTTPASLHCPQEHTKSASTTGTA